MLKQNRRSEPFFFYFGCFLLTIVVGGFSAHIVINPEMLTPVTPVIVSHGIIMTLWYTLFCIQAGLVRTNNVKTHMMIGRVSVLLAVGIVVSGYFVSIAHYLNHGSAGIMSGFVVQMFTFSLFYSAAVYQRKRTDVHKRLMLFASVALISPALARVCFALQIDQFVSLPILLALLTLIVVNDYKTIQRVHPVTKLGVAVMIFGIFLMILGVMLNTWSNFVRSVYGH